MTRLFFLLVLLALLGGCAHRARPVAAFVKPSVAPVARPVLQARSTVARAADEVTTARAGAERASVLAKAAVEVGVVAHSEAATALAGEVESLKTGLFRVTAALREAQEQLDQADAQLVELDATIAKQTEELNVVDAQRVNALAEASAAVASAKAAKGEAATAKRELAWAHARTWLVGGGISVLLVLAFAFKLIGAGARFG